MSGLNFGMDEAEDDFTVSTPLNATGEIGEEDNKLLIQGGRQSGGGVYGFGATAAALGFGASVDFADTVFSSIGFTDRNEISSKALNALGSPGLMNWYQNNRGAVEMGSSIAAVIASDLAAGRVLKSGGMAMKALSKIPYANRVAKLDGEYYAALERFRDIDVRTAQMGEIGLEGYTANTMIPEFVSLGAGPATWNQAAGAFRKAAITRGAVKGLTQEAILAAGANSNEFLFADDLSTNILYGTLGLAGGALIDTAMAQYVIKRMSVSDVANRAAQKALDPFGTEEARLKGDLATHAGYDLETLKTFDYDKNHHTDLATSYALSSAEGRKVENSFTGGLFANRNKLANSQYSMFVSETNKVTTSGMGVSGTSFAMNSGPEALAIEHAIYKDPTALFGVGALGKVPEGGIETFTTDYFSKLRTQIQELESNLEAGGTPFRSTQKDKATGRVDKVMKIKPFDEAGLKATQDTLKHLKFLESRDLFAFVDGEKVPISVGKMFEGLPETKILKETSDEEYSIWQHSNRHKDDLKLGLSSQLEIFTPRNQSVGKLGLHDSVHMYRIGDKVVDYYLGSENRTMFVPAKANWFQLDLAEEFLKRGGDEAKLVFGDGFTRETAKLESWKQKVNEIGTEFSGATEEKLRELRYKYNLPRLTAMEQGLFGTEQHPIEVLFRGMAKDSPDYSYQQLIQGINQVREVNGMLANAKTHVDDTVGNMFSFMKDNRGNHTGVVIGASRPLKPFEWTKDNLAERLAMRKAFAYNTLTAPQAPEYSKLIASSMLTDPNYIEAMKVDTLREVQMSSAIPLVSTRGLGGDLMTREWRDRANPVLQAASKLSDRVDRLARSYAEEAINRTIGGALKEINLPTNLSSRIMANDFYTFRSGWDLKVLKAGPVTKLNDKGFAEFILDPTSEHNRARWMKTFGEEMPENATLRAPDGRAIALDSIAATFVRNFDVTTRDILANKNSIRRAKGLPEINTVAHYAPPPNLKGKYVGFTLDAAGNPVPNGTIVAATPAEYAEMKAALSDPANPYAPLRDGSGNYFMDRDQITDFDALWDKAQMNLVDPSTTALQGGRKSQGRLLGQKVNPTALEDAVLWARDNYFGIARDVRETMVENAIKSARARAELARPRKPNQVSGRLEAAENSIFDHYLNNIAGRSQLDSSGSVVGSTTRNWETRINKMLEDKVPAGKTAFRESTVGQALAAAREFVSHAPIVRNLTESEHDTYKKVAAKLGDHMPYRSISEFLEAQSGKKRPPELSELIGKTSQFEAFMRLRAFESLHAVLNMAGIVNNMPAVVRSMQKMAGESDEAWQARIGHVGLTFNPGKPIGVFDTGKLIVSALKDAWNVKNHPNFYRWQKQGYITQEVAEFHRQMGVASTREGWKRAFFGDPKADTEAQRLGLTGIVSYLSDKSEDLTRGWAHISGYKLGQHLGLTDEVMLDSFAHDFANKTIANYDPLNRQAIFQGPFGAPLGLFQSFTVAYYQRLFNYLETGNMRALGTQLASQSAIFGVKTLPGYALLNELVMKENDGNDSITDSLYDNMDGNVADLLYMGVLSNLTGADLASRGDVNPRIPGFQGLPVIDTLSRAVGGMQQVWKTFADNHPDISTNRYAEIISNMLTNRPIAGAVEVFGSRGEDGQSYDTSFDGQVVSESVGFMEQLYRILGTKSIRQSKEIDAFYLDKNANEMQNVKMSNLRESYRSAVRSGEDPDPESYFAQYVLAGGDPRRFTQWMRNNTDAAGKTRQQRMAERLAKSKNDPELLQRLLNMGVDIEEDEPDEENPSTNPYHVPLDDMPTPGVPEAFNDMSQVEENAQMIDTPEGAVQF